MTALVDAAGFTTLPGSRPNPWFKGVAVADPAGDTSTATADKLVRQLCDHTLCLDNYETILTATPASPPAAPPDA
jgi:hypothetical protein